MPQHIKDQPAAYLPLPHPDARMMREHHLLLENGDAPSIDAQHVDNDASIPWHYSRRSTRCLYRATRDAASRKE